MGSIRQNQVQLDQLTRLRDALKREGVLLNMFYVRSYMEDIIVDNSLRSMLFKPVSHGESKPELVSKAIWYCICNKNADRDVLVEKLYVFFVDRSGVNEGDALALISYVLFLGGIDFQLNEVNKPSPASKSPGANGSGSGGKNNLMVKKKSRWVVPVAIAVTALLLVLFLPKSKHGGFGNDDHTLFKSSDLCHRYEGTIEKNNKKEEFIMDIFEDSKNDVLHVKVIHKANQTASGTTQYTATLKKNELRLEDGPSLRVVKKTGGRIQLSCEEGSCGKWFFNSR